ncbi:hypothetical protein [Fructobacillus papyrifericola]|uniref:Uncharacterized protein n=1 Tax=Fructobacillus papyrifericola TaxID=2713172 RepID=A0ABS5QRM5_9LACO|nr:hypothetical protein [Fructobacillus papyrifericola]MBS9335848.1 hypothetical protein [Fructobacillus papyrifericola]
MPENSASVDRETQFSKKDTHPKGKKWIWSVVAIVLVVAIGVGVGFKIHYDQTHLSGAYSNANAGTTLKFSGDRYSVSSTVTKTTEFSGKYFIKDGLLVLSYTKGSKVAKEAGTRGVAVDLSDNHKTITIQGSDYKK